MQTLHTPLKLINFDNPWSAQLLLEILEERGIPFVLKRFADRAYGSLWELQKGWGTLWVEAEDAEGVLWLYGQVLAAYESNAPTHDAAPAEDRDTGTQTQSL